MTSYLVDFAVRSSRCILQLCEGRARPGMKVASWLATCGGRTPGSDPCDTDIFIITTPKSGTVWLKALSFAIVNRSNYTPSTNPLLTTNPPYTIPFFEIQLYHYNQNPDLSKLQSPRLFATHIPYSSLPESILTNSNCRILYLCRNPKDAFVSMWHFLNSISEDGQMPVGLDEAFQLFCKGAIPFGPFWEHVLDFWKLSLEKPKHVLFLKYEDMKADTNSHIKKMADFLGYPFSSQEVEKGVVDEISKLCSFEHLSNLEVNKTGLIDPREKIPNHIFFRKAKVGDWSNHLTQQMILELDEITKEKLNGTGVMF
ncbi:LOW QUALITY PROTEIN: hypothetical protein AQUCO_00400693v1 [Aquilegia coerulea]|uniref:Sulfotransferase n=1 Tax=Aquilegia coerulea TaxID=218851 RepID=A0A2G5EW76_AQUCA|nr:LOW QUALITY PROTEIN: hypothetical protein AQUCO_00400693v1 [Aquilegia coerulea]